MDQIKLDSINNTITILFTKKIYPFESITKTVNLFHKFGNINITKINDATQVIIQSKNTTTSLYLLANEFCNHALNESKKTYLKMEQ